MSRSLGRALVLAAATSLAVSVLVGAPAASASTTESALVTKINAARAAAGLPAVSVRSDLVAAARRHSSAMAGRNALYHSSLAGICCFGPSPRTSESARLPRWCTWRSWAPAVTVPTSSTPPCATSA